MFYYYLNRIVKEFKLNQNQWFGVLSLLILIAFIQFFSGPINSKKTPPLPFQKNSTHKNQAFESNFSVQLQEFDPNKLDQMGWQNLDFSPKQAQSILKYKKMLGGKFTSKEQIEKCFVVSNQKFNELRPFILLPDVSQKPVENNFPIQEKPKYKQFSPNDLDKMGWQKLGFSPKQAQSILKYKKMLGGKFTSKEQIEKCFVISNQKFNELAPYIQLKVEDLGIEKPQITAQTTDKKNELTSFNPNDLDETGWQKLGFSQKQTLTILKYKKSLGGNFSSKEQIQKCFVVSAKKFQEIEAFIEFMPK